MVTVDFTQKIDLAGRDLAQKISRRINPVMKYVEYLDKFGIKYDPEHMSALFPDLNLTDVDKLQMDKVFLLAMQIFSESEGKSYYLMMQDQEIRRKCEAFSELPFPNINPPGEFRSLEDYLTSKMNASVEH